MGNTHYFNGHVQQQTVTNHQQLSIIIHFQQLLNDITRGYLSRYLELWRTSPAITMTQGQVAQGLRVLQQICLLAFFAISRQVNSGYHPVQHISTSVLFISWLVVQLPLWKLWIRQLGWWLFSTYGKIKVMFQSPPTRISPHPHSHHFSS